MEEAYKEAAKNPGASPFSHFNPFQTETANKTQNKQNVSNINASDEKLDFIINTYKADPKNFAEKYFEHIIQDGNGFRDEGYKKDLRDLIRKEPAQAYLIIRSLATYVIPEKQAATGAEIKKVIDTFQKLMGPCKENVLKPLDKIGYEQKISLDSHGNWEIKYSFNSAIEAQKKFRAVEKQFNLTGFKLIMDNKSFGLVLSTDDLSKILGIPKDHLTPLLFDIPISEACVEVFRIKNVSPVNLDALKAAIMHGKNIIAKAIEDESITDKELRVAFGERFIDLSSEFFQTNKDDPNDKPDLIKLMNNFRPNALNDMEIEELNTKLMHTEQWNEQSSELNLDDLSQALNAYQYDEGLLGKIVNNQFEETTTVTKVFQEAIAENSKIRNEIKKLKNDSSEEAQDLANILERIIVALEKIPGLK